MVLGLFLKEELLDVVVISQICRVYVGTVMTELQVQMEKGPSAAGVSFLKSRTRWG